MTRPISAVARRPTDLAPEAVDLTSWALDLSDADYRQASRAHLALGHHRDAPGFVSVESFAGVFLVNRHRPETLEPHLFSSRSAGGRAYLTRRLSVAVDVTWTMAYRPQEPRGQLECRLDVRFAGPTQAVARRLGVPRLLQAHAEEELAHFAKSIEATAVSSPGSEPSGGVAKRALSPAGAWGPCGRRGPRRGR